MGGGQPGQGLDSGHWTLDIGREPQGLDIPRSAKKPDPRQARIPSQQLISPESRELAIWAPRLIGIGLACGDVHATRVAAATFLERLNV
jgi:hypothetical protein